MIGWSASIIFARCIGIVDQRSRARVHAVAIEAAAPRSDQELEIDERRAVGAGTAEGDADVGCIRAARRQHPGDGLRERAEYRIRDPDACDPARRHRGGRPWVDDGALRRNDPYRSEVAGVVGHRQIEDRAHAGERRRARERIYAVDVSLGFVEGLNNKIRVIQRRAYGLRDEEYLRLKVLTCMLPEL